MKKTWYVMIHEIRTTLRRKTFVIFAFGLPLVLAIIAVAIGFANRDTATELAETIAERAAAEAMGTPGYVDEGNLIAALPDDVPEDWMIEYPNVEAAQQALEEGEINGYFVIPADYIESGELLHVKLTHDPLSSGGRTGVMEWILLYNLFEGDAQLAADVWNPLEVKTTSLATAEEQNTEDVWIVELLPNLMSLVLYMVILIASGVLVQAITDEKKNRVMEVLLSSVSTNQMITGKILGVAILGLLMMLAWGALMWGVANFGGQPLSIPAGFELPADLLFWSAIYALFGYLMYGSLMAGLGALAPDIKDTRSASLIVLSPFILAYMFMIVVIELPNGAIAILLSLFPLTSPVAMITRMTVTEIPFWQASLAAVLQLAGAIVIIRLVARLFRAQTLLSGQSFEAKRFFAMLAGRV
jgi:ABC-2 type transport system permease protein